MKLKEQKDYGFFIEKLISEKNVLEKSGILKKKIPRKPKNFLRYMSRQPVIETRVAPEQSFHTLRYRRSLGTLASPAMVKEKDKKETEREKKKNYRRRVRREKGGARADTICRAE